MIKILFLIIVHKHVFHRAKCKRTPTNWQLMDWKQEGYQGLNLDWPKRDNPLNTYWKWFHVCEHEANHRGQIEWLQSRLSGAKASKE